MIEQTCKNCIHAGEPHEFGEQVVVECRIDAVTINGFPVSREAARCGRGEWEQETPEPETTDPVADVKNYITVKQDDGTILTLFVPDTISMLYFRVKQLEQEVDYLMREK